VREEHQSSGRPIVYIVDDDASVLRGLSRLLGAYGHNVKVFDSPHKLLASALPEKNTCLVIDVAMPEMDGLTLYATLLEKGCQAPAIFITALDDPAMRNSVTRIGGAAFFQKPFEGETLIKAIDEAMTANHA
jgi:FixJ family two-component response regulator